MVRKIFTVAEANSLIPLFEDVFADFERRERKITNCGRKLEVLDLLWGSGLNDPGNPDYGSFITLRRSIENEVSQIERVIQDEIIRRGARFPNGGLEYGLIDFPSTYQGRGVFLCWRNGEPELRYWHEEEAGYAGRQPITDEHRLVMGKERGPGVFEDF